MERKGLEGDFKGGTGMKNQKKKKSSYSKVQPIEKVNYKQIAIDSRIKKPFLCEFCGRTRWTECHHIRCSYRGKRKHNPDNLMLLCHSCHHEIHSIWGNTFELRQQLLGIVLKLIKTDGK